MIRSMLTEPTTRIGLRAGLPPCGVVAVLSPQLPSDEAEEVYALQLQHRKRDTRSITPIDCYKNDRRFSYSSTPCKQGSIMFIYCYCSAVLLCQMRAQLIQDIAVAAGFDPIFNPVPQQKQHHRCLCSTEAPQLLAQHHRACSCHRLLLFKLGHRSTERVWTIGC